MSDWNDNVITEFRESKGTTNYWGPKLVILHSIGAKSGEERLHPVVGFERNGGWQVVASKGGAPENPAWYRSFVANPQVMIQDGTSTGDYVVHEATGEERENWWKFCVEAFPPYAEYQEKANATTGRQIPVFICKPAEAPHS